MASLEQRYIHIRATDPHTSHTNFNTLATTTSYAVYHYRVSSGVQNDEVTYTVTLPAGTYSLTYTQIADTNRGISTFKIAGSSVGTIDSYAGATANKLSTITGIVVASLLTNTTLQVIMATKNGSSSDYYGLFGDILLQRTA